MPATILQSQPIATSITERRQHILQKINSCNSSINSYKIKIAKLDEDINLLLQELQGLKAEYFLSEFNKMKN